MCLIFDFRQARVRTRCFLFPFWIGIIFGIGLTTSFLHYSSFSNVSTVNFVTVTVTPSPQRAAAVLPLPRVLCWILTGPTNHHTKAIHVRNTWGKRCNKLIFMSSAEDKELGTIALPNTNEGRDFLWDKTEAAFKYVWNNHKNDADWFLKADDDTYMIMENLRFFLSQFNTSKSIYFGTKMRRIPRQNELFMAGGSGYVLSKEALSQFIKFGHLCSKRDSLAEDVRMSQCLTKIGVHGGDARDMFGRNLFLPLSPEAHLFPGNSSSQRWYLKYSYYSQKEGLNCCSNQAISFHQITPAQIPWGRISNPANNNLFSTDQKGESVQFTNKIRNLDAYTQFLNRASSYCVIGWFSFFPSYNFLGEPIMFGGNGNDGEFANCQNATFVGYQSARFRGPSDMETPALALIEGTPETPISGEEVIILESSKAHIPLTNTTWVNSYGQTNWTLYTEPHFRGNSWCFREAGKRINFSPLNTTVKSVRRGCGNNEPGLFQSILEFLASHHG